MTNPDRQLFASDNSSGVHPEVMARLAEVNQGHVLGYGGDPYTQEVQRRFKAAFGEQAQAFLALTGTGANVMALQGMARSHETVYCSDEAHLLLDECGAPEHIIGCKLLPLPSVAGKVDFSQLKTQVQRDAGFVHRSQPRVISLAQATERGTLYSLAELEQTVAFARAHRLYTHLDGARLANAAVALGASFQEMTTDLGIDVVSFGGTKNGLMMAEALVVLNPELGEAFPYIRKQGMQLASKHRFLAAQYLAYFENDLWKRNATHANAMARYLADQLAQFPEVTLTAPVEVNVLFATLPQAWIAPLQEYCHFNVWDAARSEVRLITSFDTSRAVIDGFISTIKTRFK